MSNLNLSEAAATIAEPSRAAILMILLDGKQHPASELAYMARITPQTASFHLSKLLSLGLIVMEKHGRHRYFKLHANAAAFVEQLLLIAPPSQVKSFREASQAKSLKSARTCYDHFAGEFGVALTDSLLAHKIITETDTNSEFQLTSLGGQFFAELGIDLEMVSKQKRAFARKCLDWSERKYHLAGALGHSLVVQFHEMKWTETVKGSRAIKVTELGKQELFALLRMQMN